MPCSWLNSSASEFHIKGAPCGLLSLCGCMCLRQPTVLRGSGRIDIMPFELFGQMAVSTEEELLEGIAQIFEALWQYGVCLSWPMYFEIAEVP